MNSQCGFVSRPGPRRLCGPGRPAINGLALAVCAFALAVFSGGALAATPTSALVKDLHNGGYVLVMRHAQSPDARPTASEAEPDNTGRERQLSPEGQANARELGQALGKLAIPIGPIYSSPTYRARETLRLAGFGAPQVVAQLEEGSRGMLGAAGAAQVAWLREAVTRIPPSGMNTLIVTHTPNIVGAFGPTAAGVKAGEMIVFKPQGHAHGIAVGRITVAQWRRLASRPGR